MLFESQCRRTVVVKSPIPRTDSGPIDSATASLACKYIDPHDYLKAFADYFNRRLLKGSLERMS